jgi:transposase-like protein
MKPHYKSMYKSDLAAIAGVSSQTLRRWCRQYDSQLEALHCSPKSKILNPAAVKFLCETFCIDLED